MIYIYMNDNSHQIFNLSRRKCCNLLKKKTFLINCDKDEKNPKHGSSAAYLKINLGKPSRKKSHVSMDTFRTPLSPP